MLKSPGLMNRRLEHLRLAIMLAKMDLRNRYASSFGGVAWNVGVPLLYALINVIVFSILTSRRMGANYGDLPFAIFYFVPLTLWAFFSEVVTRSTGIMREYGYLINKIAFPFWILPLVPVASALLNQFILIVVVAALMAYYGVAPAHTIYLYIPLWFVSLILTLGVAYLVAALAVYVPDLSHIVPIFINILFWMTPILYPSALIEENASGWVRTLILDWNPFSYIVQLTRNAVFGLPGSNWYGLLRLFCFVIFVFIIGLAVFRKLRRGFADVL